MFSPTIAKKENDWVSEWKATNALPKLMRVSLGLGKDPQRPSEPQDLYTREIGLPATAVQPAWQVALAGAGQRPTNAFGSNLFQPGQRGFQPLPGQPFNPGGRGQQPIRVR